MRNVFVSVVSAAFLAVGIVWVAQPAAAATEQIEAGSDYFCAPSFEGGVCTTEVTAGDTVTWNIVQGAHTVTECEANFAACPPAAGGFDSGVLEATATFSQTFNTVGDVAYYCALHPTTMRGIISVVAAATDAPTPPPGGTDVPAQTDDPGAGPATTSSPAAVPTSGGEPPADGLPLQALMLALGGVLAVVGVGALYAARRP
jgi:plastocyanin